jgi:hypothetical protein
LVYLFMYATLCDGLVNRKHRSTQLWASRK